MPNTDNSAGVRKQQTCEPAGQKLLRYSWYQGKSQQDAHELLRTLLGALADELEAPEDQQSCLGRHYGCLMARILAKPEPRAPSSLFRLAASGTEELQRSDL